MWHNHDSKSLFLYKVVWVLCLFAQLCPTLCDPMDCICQAPLYMRILQARILEWVAMPSSRGSFQYRDWTQVSHLTSEFFIIWATREAKLKEKPKLKNMWCFCLDSQKRIYLILCFYWPPGWKRLRPWTCMNFLFLSYRQGEKAFSPLKQYWRNRAKIFPLQTFSDLSMVWLMIFRFYQSTKAIYSQ